MVVVNNARFTVLTPALIRIEFSNISNPTTGGYLFEDRATIAIVNRDLPVPSFTSNLQGSLLTLKTEQVALQYDASSGFLQAVRSDDPHVNFTLGQDTNSNSGNLLGTICSLDELNVVSLNCTTNANIQVHGQSLHCAWGVIGRRGFALLDDTGNWALTADAAWWAPTPNTDALDVYLFIHGFDYKRALRDFTLISGSPAMVPRAALGIWGTRWYNYAANDVKRVVSEYATRGLPFDVQVLDMNWHSKQEWTGWTPDGTLFPVPEDAYDWLHQQGLVVLVNIHDAQGVGFYEQMFAPFAASLGYSTDPLVTNTVPFSAVNQSYLYNLDDIVVGHLIDLGIDYMWIDWQQGVADTAGNGQNPTIILAKVRATDYLRWGLPLRGLVLSRFGGYGAQRYPVGFSGDVASLTWANLAFQPYFSWTAANVAFTWSHDLVGPHDDHEMHTRWLQWGAYSGIFRTHDRGMSSGTCNNDVTIDTPGACPIVEPWMVPEIYFLANRACIRDRAALLPYLYTATFDFFTQGLSLLRPMYFEYPSLPAAYLGDPHGLYAQYFFGGPDMIVAPVVFPADHTQMALLTTWLPPGDWYERDTGVLHAVSHPEGTTLTKYYDLSEIPIFIRAGAIIPTIPLPQQQLLGAAANPYSSLIFTVYPGLAANRYQVYEDDGNSTAYLQQAYGFSTFQYSRTATRFAAKITAAPPGAYLGQPQTRQWTVILVNAVPPTTVQIDNINLGTTQTATFQRFLIQHQNTNTNQQPTWSYDGESFALIVTLPPLSIPNTDVQITITWSAPVNDTQLSGYKGIFRHAMLAKGALDLPSVTEGSHAIMGGYLNLATSLPDALGYWAGHNLTQFHQVIQQYRSNILASAVQELAGMLPYVTGSYLQLYSQGRFDSCLCGDSQCMTDNDDYQQVLIEGYQVTATTPGAIPLYWYWSPTNYDNYMTTNGQLNLAGYQTVGINGYILQSPNATNAPTLPLSVYYHPVYLDHMTVATTAGTQWAIARGYQLLEANIGWVLAQNPGHTARQEVPNQTVLYAQTLLNNIYPPRV